MKRLNFFILILTFNTGYAFSCDIITYPYIYIISGNLDYKIIKKSNCPLNVQNSFIETISYSNGQLPIPIIQSQIAPSEFETVHIIPSQVQVTDMQDYLQERVQLVNNRKIFNLRSLNNINSIHSNFAISPIIHCNGCDQSGEKNIKLQIADKYYWFSMTIKEPRQIWTPKKDLPAYTDTFSNDDFETKLIFDTGKNSYFYDLKNIKYYKTTRKLSKGSPLLNSSLTPQRLVVPGKKVTLILKGKNISLKSQVLAIQTGHIGDILEFKNPRSNKKFIAKVIDFNTAEVQL